MRIIQLLPMVNNEIHTEKMASLSSKIDNETVKQSLQNYGLSFPHAAEALTENALDSEPEMCSNEIKTDPPGSIWQ